MNNIPQDPLILFGWVNTQLRDHYPSLQALCDSLDIDIDMLTATLLDAGFEYVPERNKFW